MAAPANPPPTAVARKLKPASQRVLGQPLAPLTWQRQPAVAATLAPVATVAKMAPAPVKTASAVIVARRQPAVAAILAPAATVAKTAPAPAKTASAVIVAHRKPVAVARTASAATAAKMATAPAAMLANAVAVARNRFAKYASGSL